MPRKKEVTIQDDPLMDALNKTGPDPGEVQERLREKLEQLNEATKAALEKELEKSTGSTVSIPAQPSQEIPQKKIPTLVKFKVASTYVCPECGQALQGASATGPMSDLMDHPWGDNLHDRMRPCPWRGRKFKVPTVELLLID